MENKFVGWSIFRQLKKRKLRPKDKAHFVQNTRKEAGVKRPNYCVELSRTPCFGQYHTKKTDWRDTQKFNIIPERYSNNSFKNWYKLFMRIELKK